ncbi:MAG TPA: methyltransferase domain-containing protein [Acidimicrobiia bacterium]|jgi:SAM-dependent methyltransferase|nr:methyltransferase domain-containing protein [Acidimicrobiia bacterium]
MGSGVGVGWPFWAATTDERIDDALRLAGLRPDERLVDLGCGDGRVLLRAAEDYGADVTGVELDPGLAAIAREVLAAAGVEGTVLEADFESVPIDADVVFAFLSPATLQRLRPRLAALSPGSRVVTTGYPVPGWVPNDLAGRVFLYRLPPDEQPVDRQLRGWVSAGALVSVTPRAPALMAVKLQPHGGPLTVSVTGSGLDGWLTIRPGLDEAAPGEPVVVDLRFDPAPDGTEASGTLQVDGIDPFRLFAVADPGEPGIWGLSESGCDVVARRMERGQVASVLHKARYSTNHLNS